MYTFDIMSEKIIGSGELSMRCGSISVRVESVDDLYTMIESQPLHLTLAAEEFADPLDPLCRSRLDYTHIKEMDATVLSGYVQFEMPDEDVWSSTQAMSALYEYLLDEALISETRINEEFNNETTVFSIDVTGGAVMNLSYDENEGASQLLLHVEVPNHLNATSVREIVANVIRMWGDLHDYVAWVSDSDKEAPLDHEIVIKKSTQPEAAFTLWQSVLDYETWRSNLDMPDLPRVDHANIDMGKIGLALVSLERDNYEFIYPELQRLGTNLRKHGTNVISSGELIVALTT